MLVNLLLGPDERVAPLPPPSTDVRASLERALIPALQREPCVVSFSGGRDSSAVLALAVDVARRNGLSLPLPVTMLFPHVPASEERDWRTAVLTHLGIEQAEEVVLGDELDALGPIAAAQLRRHGVRWPFNAHMHAPILALARGGTLLTGIGGDELLGSRTPPLSSRQRMLALMPSPVRRSAWRARHAPGGYGWLTARGRRRVQRAVAREEVSSPQRWQPAVEHWYASRAFAAVDGALTLVAGAEEVEILNPLLDHQVLADLAARGDPHGFTSRTAAMHTLCGSLLPPAVLDRRTKATFGGAVWGPVARQFAAEWDGSGVDPRYVDANRLREELLTPDPDVRLALLLQSAWLANRASISASS
jgi:asparagine synthase (glutamine-hydrolysing)